MTIILDQPMWYVVKGLCRISRKIPKWNVSMFPLHVLLEMIWSRECPQTNWALVLTRIMIEVVILHINHNFTTNFTLPWCSWREFHKQCLIIGNFIQYHRHCSSCKRTNKSAITTSMFCYRHLIHGIKSNKSISTHCWYVWSLHRGQPVYQTETNTCILPISQCFKAVMLCF